MVPVLEYWIRGKTLHYRWRNVVPGFDMPIRVTLSGSAWSVLHPTEAWKTTPLRLADVQAFRVDSNYYVSTRDVGGPPPAATGRKSP
jgi:hypothetical protein